MISSLANVSKLSRQSKCGRNLSAFVVYQVIELRISQHAVAQKRIALKVEPERQRAKAHEEQQERTYER
jgi:hypothetical protein